MGSLKVRLAFDACLIFLDGIVVFKKIDVSSST
jgi:hypothetical protein